VITSVCLNPALDVTHHVPRVDWTEVNRPGSVHTRPGGKGLNVARTLHALGVDVLAMGLSGGVTGAGVEAALAGLGLPAVFTRVSGETRRTFTVVDGASGAAAGFHEPGPRLSSEEFAEFCVKYEKALDGSAAVALSGSLPPGLPASAYATLIEMASAAGVPAVLDAHGEALLRGAAAGPAVVKPNLAELESLTGQPLPVGRGDGLSAVADAARRLLRAGAHAVVASLGADGLLAVTPEGCWRAEPPAAVTGNPTGAGDAVTAGLVQGLAHGWPWEERLRHAVALGTSAVAAPVAGEFSQDEYQRVLAAATVSRDGGR
jgi:1-phosphofructokinase family hexose kinase